ncbi:MAG: hypothetical protein FWC23_02580 [Chitinispirillia bacterium]|nr:hypothetical protein [Chitinispirillia bacterium]MCL2268062.1 hypothetical protein [Chitinispirillia bacterium]
MKKYFALILPVLLLAAAQSAATNLANPAAQIPGARMSFGASYYLGGADITNLEIPMMINRIGGRVSYAPVPYVNFGADFGTAQVSVDQYAIGRDIIPIFNGNLGWSVGGHLKLSTPYIANTFAVLALGHVNYFSSANKLKAYYAGTDIAAAAGLQFRIPGGGVLSFGPQLYMIEGANKGFNGEKDKYKAVNNMRAWIAFDYFPEETFIMWDQKPYVSIEFTASPKISGSRRAPIQEFGVSISVGAITQRLYGEDSGDE